MEKKLKAIRAGNRTAITRLFTKFEELETSETKNIGEIKAIEDAMVQKRTVLQELNDKLVDVISDDDIEQEIAQTDEYMFNLDSKLRQIRLHTQQIQETSPLNANAESFMPTQQIFNTNTSAANSDPVHEDFNMPDNSRNENYSNVFPARSTDMHNTYVQRDITAVPYREASVSHTQFNTNSIRLPKLDLPHFDGDILQWSTFWDSFESTIHYNSQLTPIQKFSYLKAQLTGTAAQTIAGFSLTHAHYETAVSLLRERYGSPQKIINAYMKALMDLPSPSNDLISLRSYGDCLESYVRGLECLGQTQEMYGALLVPIIISKLPVEIRKNIAREYDTDNINLKILRKAITKEVKVLETGEFTDDQEFRTTATFLTGARNTGPSKSIYKKHNASGKKEVNTRPCIYCSGIHFPGECTNVITATDRLKIVKQKKLCFNCLGNHRVSDCKSNKRCKKCNKKHHTSICENITMSDSIQGTNNSTSVNLVKTDDETETLVMYSAQQRTNVLLKTAIAPVSYRHQTTDANILFDEGAQRSFISQSLASKLKIKPTRRDTIELSAFGDTEKNVRHLETATIDLKFDKGGKLSIDVLIVPDIAVPLQNQTKYLRNNLPYLRNLKLAHPLNNEDKFEISLLIGADYYWNVIQDEVIRGDGPTAVASKIGYLLSGPIYDNTPKSPISSVLLNVISTHQDIDSSIERFWNLESLGIRPPDQDEDQSFLTHYQNNSIKFKDGHYSAMLPWKLNHPDLPSNIAIAKKRTENTIRRLSREPHLLQKYTDIMEDEERRVLTSLKSRPRNMISDNGSTYLSASETIKKLTQSSTINAELTNYGTSWTFIPKRAPWYGGWWERLIGLTKNCLKKTLGRSYVTFETLRTIVTEIEAIINDRPLTYISPDIEDEEPLTPSHLLYGRRITTTPYPQEERDTTVNCDRLELCKRFNTQSLLINHFWNRWKSEYLTALRECHKQSGHNVGTIQIGDVVQVQEDKQPRNRWNIAIVEELITGNDGLTRAAIIRTSKGRTSRPIVKLYPLEIRTNTNTNTVENEFATNEGTSRCLPRRDASTRARENIKQWTNSK